MNKIYFFIVLALAMSCTGTAVTDEAGSSFSASATGFDWLLGNWHRSNEQEGKETFEHWTKVSDTEYIGLGYTMMENDTIWKEDIRLIRAENGWVFQVTVPEESQPVLFRLTNADAESFTCENAENDFPKLIRYYKNGDNINAMISGGGMEIPFEFARLAVKEIIR
jgi:hypothetical protein